MQNLFDLRAM